MDLKIFIQVLTFLGSTIVTHRQNLLSSAELLKDSKELFKIPAIMRYPEISHKNGFLASPANSEDLKMLSSHS